MRLLCGALLVAGGLALPGTTNYTHYCYNIRLDFSSRTKVQVSDPEVVCDRQSWLNETDKYI